jgi:hypothetical protein
MMNWDYMNGWMGAWMWIPAALLLALGTVAVIRGMTRDDDGRAPRS